LLFADYDAGLHWFRSALAARPSDEPLIDSVQAAIFAFPYDVQGVTRIASLRSSELEPDRIARAIRQVEGDFAEAIAEHLRRRPSAADASLRITVAARCIAAAVFAAMELWMMTEDRSLADLAAMCQSALGFLEGPPFRQY
jgi:hypothetical protein